jgi:hypothetical protein
MRISNLLKAVKSPEHRLALLVAMIGDAVQILGLPLFAAGGFSPADTLLDAVMAIILIRMLGWHWADTGGGDDSGLRSVSYLDYGCFVRDPAE